MINFFCIVQHVICIILHAFKIRETCVDWLFNKLKSDHTLKEVLGDAQQKRYWATKGYFILVLCVNLPQTQFCTNQYTQMVCEPDAVTWTDMGKEWSNLIDLLRLPWKQFWIHFQHRSSQQYMSVRQCTLRKKWSLLCWTCTKSRSVYRQQKSLLKPFKMSTVLQRCMIYIFFKIKYNAFQKGHIHRAK